MSTAALFLLATTLFLYPYSAFAGAAAQSPSPATAPVQAEVIFQFDRPGLAVSHFTLRLREDGAGSYQAEQAEVPATNTTIRGQAAQHIDRSINLSSARVAKIFKAARALNYFNTECASKAKNIADTGKKRLGYSGPDGSGSCVYNYSESKTVDMLTDTFLGIAYTLDEGRRLEFLHRYDRLGLDAEMNSFAQELKAGRAQEVVTISSALAAIVDDNAVIERVRVRAKQVLEQCAMEDH